MKRNEGISLIVLVITIIVMVILSGVVVLTLNNTGIIDKSSEAVEKSNLATVKEIAELAWAEAYMAGKTSQQELENAINEALTKNKITEEYYEGYIISVTSEGVEFLDKELNHINVTLLPGGKYAYGDYLYTRNIISGSSYGAQTIEEAKILIKEEMMNEYWMTWEGIVTDFYNGDEQQIWEQYGVTAEKFKPAVFDSWWIVALNEDVTDSTKTTYGPILESINGLPVTSMEYLFSACRNLVEIPMIPSNITDMTGAFNACDSLTDLSDFVIPYGVKNMRNTFSGCDNLTIAPKIPNSVTNMSSTFSGCDNLTTAPKISNNVTTMDYTFYNCKNLVVAPIIPNSVTDLTTTFQYCSALKTYEGAPEGTASGDFSKYVIPNGVTTMQLTFWDCDNITKAPVIPNTVKNMRGTFGECNNLTTAPVIPSSVTYLETTFYNCTSLAGTVTINTNHISSVEQINNNTCYRCFANVDMTNITLTGLASKEILNLIGTTGNNYTPIP